MAVVTVSISWWDFLISYFKSFGSFREFCEMGANIRSDNIIYAIKIIIFQKLKSIFSFKLKGLDLEFVHNATINMLIGVSLSIF